MPEYIVFSICLIILSVTGVLKSPCRAVGLSMFEMLYMLLCALALSVFDMTLSVELKVNAGAAVMIFLPALLVLPSFYQTDGVWLAQPISDVISFVVAIVLLTKYIKKFKAAQPDECTI